MKKYIQPAIELDMVHSLKTLMLDASGEEIGGSTGGGDAKKRAEEEAAQQNAWDDGLW